MVHAFAERPPTDDYELMMRLISACKAAGVKEMPQEVKDFYAKAGTGTQGGPSIADIPFNLEMNKFGNLTIVLDIDLKKVPAGYTNIRVYIE